ncbi:outer membrane protein transport protein [Lonepinella sp. BR2271]|uniref:outer membrane protein transport protein n=1 Tax=Lonepinella sp. BR2271 TaxID=3434550 RepID=UPI003F6DBCF4
MKNLFTKTLLSSALLAATGAANAAAFQLAEISTSGLGRAYAGEAAIADNAGVVATNPALMSLFKRTELSLGAIYVDPNIDIEGTTLYGTGADTNANAKDIAKGALVPNIYFVAPINDKFAIGGGLNVNYGLATEYDDNYSAGFIAGKTDLTALNFNLSGSYKVLDSLTLGLGVNAVYADAIIERRLGSLTAAPYLVAAQTNAAYATAAAQGGDYAAAAGYKSAAQQAIASAQTAAANPSSATLRKIEGDKWGFGWNAGLMWQVTENSRFGLAYHSKIDIDFTGEYSDGGEALRITPDYTLSQGNQSGSLTLPLPAYWELSGFHQVTDKFAFHYSWKYTEWSKFKELRAVGSSGNELFQKTEKYRDSSRLALGATYNATDALTVRAGIAYDETAANEHHSISIPDTNRVWYSLGATYRFTPDLSVDVGFAHLRGSNNSFKEELITSAGKIVTDVKVKATANLYGLNVNYRF